MQKPEYISLQNVFFNLKFILERSGILLGNVFFEAVGTGLHHVINEVCNNQNLCEFKDKVLFANENSDRFLRADLYVLKQQNRIIGLSLTILEIGQDDFLDLLGELKKKQQLTKMTIIKNEY